MPIARVRTALTGIVQGGGLTTHYFDIRNGIKPTIADDLIATVENFWDPIRTRMSNQVSNTILGQVDILDTNTGAIVDIAFGATSTMGPGGSSSAPYPPSIQALARMTTDTVVGGRRLRGRLFIPGSVTPPGGDSKIPEAAWKTAIETGCAAAAAVNDSEDYTWVVWSKKNGVAATITGWNCWDKFATLRSRRD